MGRAVTRPAGATIEWLTGTAVKLDMPDEAFDLILCQQGLQFFADRGRCRKEMRRLLAQGGRIMVSVWQALSRHPAYQALFEATTRHLDVPMSAVDVSFSLSDAGELRSLLSSAGFDRIRIAERSLDVTLESADLFVKLTVQGAAASIPAFPVWTFRRSPPSSTPLRRRWTPSFGTTGEATS